MSKTAPAPNSTPSYALYLTEPGDPNAISSDDVHQASLGDCYLDATVAEIAIQDPSLISSMIKDDGNGTYTVNLYTPYNRILTPQTATVAGISPQSVNSTNTATS